MNQNYTTKVLNYHTRYKIIEFFQNINIIGFRKFSNVLPTMLLPKPNRNVTIKTIHGFTLNIDPVLDKGVERQLYYTGTYERGSLYIIKKLLKKGDCFVDAGANIGLMSIFGSQCVGSDGVVYAFEPNSKTFEMLLHNIHLNELDNIKPFQIGLGSKMDSLPIYNNWESGRGSASIVNKSESSTHEMINIDRLDKLLKDRQPHLIKIDVEGFELEVLRGCGKLLASEKAPMLILEFSNSRNINSNQLYQFVKGVNSYSFYKSKGSKKRRSKLVEIRSEEDLPKHDNVYCFLHSHLIQIDKNLVAN